jgi:hypothetical protein
MRDRHKYSWQAASTVSRGGPTKKDIDVADCQGPAGPRQFPHGNPNASEEGPLPFDRRQGQMLHRAGSSGFFPPAWDLVGRVHICCRVAR